VYAEKIELNSLGVAYVSKFKARLTVDGSRKRYGIDYFDTFAGGESFRILLLIRLLYPTHEWRNGMLRLRLSMPHSRKEKNFTFINLKGMRRRKLEMSLRETDH
jgi:hypothetical protein